MGSDEGQAVLPVKALPVMLKRNSSSFMKRDSSTRENLMTETQHCAHVFLRKTEVNS
jgi:hypothetical protein